MKDKENWSIFVEKIKQSLNCTYSFLILHEMTETLTASDEMMKIYENEYIEYEELHQNTE